MKFMMFEAEKGSTLGLVDGQNVIELAVLDASLPKDLLTLVQAGPAALAAVKAAAAKSPAAAKHPLASVKPALPIAHPPKFICVGLNYLEHAKEGGHGPPTYPSFLRATIARSSPLANR